MPAVRCPTPLCPAGSFEEGSRITGQAPSKFLGCRAPLTLQGVVLVPLSRGEARGGVCSAGGERGGTASLSREGRTGSGSFGGAWVGSAPRAEPPAAQGGSSTADSGGSAPRAAAAPTPGCPNRGAGAAPGAAGSVLPIPVPSFCAPTSSPGAFAGRCGKTPPPPARVSVSGMGGSAVGQGAVAQLKGRRGLQRGPAPAEVQDGRNTPEFVLPVLLHFPAEMERGVGKAECSGSWGGSAEDRDVWHGQV